MEGISHEAASFAGHQRLGRLVVVYDDNHITIDGPTELTVTDDASARFRSYGWQVLDAGEIGDDVDALETVLLEAVADPTRPTLIRLRTHIGVPSPAFTDTSAAHGSPFPAEEIARTKQLLGLPVDESWWIGDDVRDHLHEAGRRHRSEREAWEARRTARPDTDLLDAVDAATGLEGWRTALPTWSPGDKVATRNSSKACLAALLDVVPGLMTGGADLTDNTGVSADCGVFRPEDRAGRLVHWGVREHAMAAAMNGLALHGGVLPLGGTFFVFSDYLRPALRLAALSQAKVVFSFTHDSVGVGEDGPTHQPVEHLMALRAMPGLRVMRPADANENAWCWRAAIEHDGPTVLVLSRQNLPVLEGTAGNPGVGDGAYVLAELGSAPTDGAGPDLVLIGTGSEVALCLDAARLLAAEGRRVRVVSMPCWELFAAQPEATQASVLGVGIPRLSVEAGVTFGWSRWAHDAVGIDRFGLSAPGDEAMAHLGLTPEIVAGRARALLES
jgi:transketolase